VAERVPGFCYQISVTNLGSTYYALAVLGPGSVLRRVRVHVRCGGVETVYVGLVLARGVGSDAAAFGAGTPLIAGGPLVGGSTFAGLSWPFPSGGGDWVLDLFPGVVVVGGAASVLGCVQLKNGAVGAIVTISGEVALMPVALGAGVLGTAG